MTTTTKTPATKTTTARKTTTTNPATTTAATTTSRTPRPRKPAGDKSATVENLSAQIAAATGTTTDKLATVTTIGAGKSTTGDNGHGFKRAAAQRAGKSTAPTSGRAPATAAAPATAFAATPVHTVKRASAKRSESEGPTPTEMKRIVANAMVQAVADMIEHWDADATKVPADVAKLAASSYLNYAPVTVWDARLADRSHAGGRGASKRAAAA